jgi:hypothetical protein
MALTNLSRLDYAVVGKDHGELVVQFEEGGEAVPLRRGMTLDQVVYSLKHLVMRLEGRKAATSTGEERSNG